MSDRNPVSGFLLSGDLVGESGSPIPRFEKNGVFLCGSYWRSRSGYSLSFFGKGAPVTILVKARILKIEKSGGTKIMARPKKDESLRKRKQISIRFSEAEYAKIVESAKKQNTTVTDYLRDRSVHGRVETTFRIIADPEEVKKAARELNGILANLQQIAKYYNAGGLYSWAMHDAIRGATDTVLTMLTVLKRMTGEGIGNYKTPVH